MSAKPSTPPGPGRTLTRIRPAAGHDGSPRYEQTAVASRYAGKSCLTIAGGSPLYNEGHCVNSVSEHGAKNGTYYFRIC